MGKAEGRKGGNITEKIEKVEWEEGLSSKIYDLFFHSTPVPSLCTYYMFNAAFVLSLCIKCAKSLCKKPWTTHKPYFFFFFAIVNSKSTYISG